jgi:hypothetical protein
MANTTYYVRTFDTNSIHSSPASFTLPACQSTPTPTPTILPTKTPSPTPNNICQGADLDHNGNVNIFDYNILVGNFGKSGNSLQGDIDNNGTVNIFDYNIIVGNFGKTGC